MTYGFISKYDTVPQEVIDRDLYQLDSSLLDAVESLCDPNREILVEDVIDLCVKYFFAHRYPDSINDKISLGEIESLFALGRKFTVLQREGVCEFDLEEASRIEDLKYFISNMYGISMLGDIAPSVEIFLSILNESFLPEVFENNYVGIDLGTGTGWLLLAQYIVARREGFKDIQLYGIELNSEMSGRTSKLIKKLCGFDIRGILVGDTTTSKSAYQYIKDSTRGKVLSYVSNENIPTCGFPMNGENDPFFQNVDFLIENMSDQVTSETQGFPSKIRYILHNQGGKTYFTSTFEKNYGLQGLKDFNNKVYGSSDISSLEVLNSLTPYGISIHGEIQKLTDIGKTLESKKGQGGKVFPLQGWRRRWSG